MEDYKKMREEKFGKDNELDKEINESGENIKIEGKKN